MCEVCWTQIHAIRVQDPLYEEMMVRLRSMAHVEGLVAKYLFEKDGILQSLIHELKYGGMRSIGVELGRRLSDDLVPALESVRITGVVPVPLHPRKKRERGYNQSEYICKGIQTVTGLNVFASLLRRVKDTKTQTQLSLDARHDNVHDAFALDTSQVEIVRDGIFLVVDDVITTGATIDACAEALMKHGAKRAVACSVALADRSCLP